MEARSARARIMHAVLFELIGLAMVVPLSAFGFGIEAGDTAVVVISLSLVATGWNYLYNLLFDQLMARWYGSIRKSVWQRVLHAILFELGLLLVTLPFVAWYLDIGIMEALIIDVAMALFYLAYAFVFNWAWDMVTLPRTSREHG
ncbi:PACE efflux transporter [Notoacmeibacter ruber]|uniref:PACE efflux transporter n=2 Tax=Notoacmeibacter ruber TaxID=2670375 RepID=A0A3L7JFU8_9HYPH|nr:PACE efflux transporter [Notoacmeibacter ruber]